MLHNGNKEENTCKDLDGSDQASKYDAVHVKSLLSLETLDVEGNLGSDSGILQSSARDLTSLLMSIARF